MVYGIGAKGLSDQLNLTESEASDFMDSFKSQYPGQIETSWRIESKIVLNSFHFLFSLQFLEMQRFWSDVISDCRVNGYVETFAGRRRFLPAINHSNPHSKAQVGK